MIDSRDLRQKLNVDETLFKAREKKEEAKIEHFDDGLSDDEEYQNMTEEERNRKMRPNLNMDGACDRFSTSEVRKILHFFRKKKWIFI